MLFDETIPCFWTSQQSTLLRRRSSNVEASLTHSSETTHSRRSTGWTYADMCDVIVENPAPTTFSVGGAGDET